MRQRSVGAGHVDVKSSSAAAPGSRARSPGPTRSRCRGGSAARRPPAGRASGRSSTRSAWPWPKTSTRPSAAPSPRDHPVQPRGHLVGGLAARASGGSTRVQPGTVSRISLGGDRPRSRRTPTRPGRRRPRRRGSRRARRCAGPAAGGWSAPGRSRPRRGAAASARASSPPSGERQVGGRRVPAVAAPLGLAVPDQPDLASSPWCESGSRATIPAMTPSREPGSARRAAFFAQGLVFISLTTRLPRLPGPLGPLRAGAVGAAADDGAARRRRLGGRPSGWPGTGQRAAAAGRAAARRGGRAGARAGADLRPVLRRRAGGVRRRARRGRRDHQHAGRRARAPLRATDPAVVPRRLDRRRHRRRDGHAGHLRAAARRRGGAAGRAAGGRVRAVPARATTAPVDAAVPDVAWRPILLVGLAMVLFYMVDTACDDLGRGLPRRRLRHPRGPGGARDVPLPGRQPGGAPVR